MRALPIVSLLCLVSRWRTLIDAVQGAFALE